MDIVFHRTAWSPFENILFSVLYSLCTLLLRNYLPDMAGGAACCTGHIQYKTDPTFTKSRLNICTCQVKSEYGLEDAVLSQDPKSFCVI